MKIVVLAGGLSPERDVSFSSGSLIANALLRLGHEVLLLDLYKGIKLETKDYSSLFFNKNDKKEFKYEVADKLVDLEKIKRENNNREELIGENVLDICKFADKVFIALHGSIGENGKLQATLDNMNIKYTGSGYIGCAVAMDKDLTKRILKASDITTAEWMVYDNNISEIVEKIGLPCVVKPCGAGSSVGVSIVINIEELEVAIKEAKKYEDFIIVEKMIKGREFSVGVFDGKALPVIEIIPKEGFYDYRSKYQLGLTLEVCPAELEVNKTKEVQEIAEKIHNVLRLGKYSRIDFILASNGEFYCLEANALPGMTPTSLVPQEAAKIGIDYDTLVAKILE